MKIRLAIVEKDINYLTRIVSAFNTKYNDKLQVYSFTDLTTAYQELNSSKMDMIIISDIFEVDFSKIPKRCGFAYFVDSSDIDTYNEKTAICKYQKADLIYKQILSVYAENVGNISGIKLSDDSSVVTLFTSVSGGSGSSSMAAAYAIYLAKQNLKTLYLNLEVFGSSDVFFQAEGQFSMSDIIFAVKSKKANLPLKLESCVKQSPEGVYFYSQSNLALDMLEFNESEIIRLISELRLLGTYDHIVIDYELDMKKIIDFYSNVDNVVWVCDGSEISNSKTVRAYTALSLIEDGNDASISNKISIIYNKFSNKTGKTVGEIGLKSLGGAPRFEHASSKQVVNQLSTMSDIFSKLV